MEVEIKSVLFGLQRETSRHDVGAAHCEFLSGIRDVCHALMGVGFSSVLSVVQSAVSVGCECWTGQKPCGCL